MSNGQLAKATITNLATDEVVTCMFNPTDYTFSKTNSWNEVMIEDQNVPNLEFGGGEPATLQVALFFDTYEAHVHPTLSITAGEDVRKYTKGLWEIMKISTSGGKSEPPRCRFEWGNFWSFEAVIISMTQKFTLFDNEGTPLRAQLNVTFKQIKDEGQYPRQNPTSGGSPGEHVRRVREGETLSGIAYEEYGDPTAWRHIAEHNPIRDPRRLQPGQMLIIKPLPNS